jgi:hypothetical protein
MSFSPPGVYLQHGTPLFAPARATGMRLITLLWFSLLNPPRVVRLRGDSKCHSLFPIFVTNQNLPLTSLWKYVKSRNSLNLTIRLWT